MVKLEILSQTSRPPSVSQNLGHLNQNRIWTQFLFQKLGILVYNIRHSVFCWDNVPSLTSFYLYRLPYVILALNNKNFTNMMIFC